MASGGLGPSVGRGQSGAGVSWAGGRLGAAGGAWAFIELPKTGAAAALLPAARPGQDIVVAAVVAEDVAAHPGNEVADSLFPGSRGQREAHLPRHQARLHSALGAQALSVGFRPPGAVLTTLYPTPFAFTPVLRARGWGW